MPIETDIFISYAHLDNEVVGAEPEGWISRFHRSLEVRLAQLLGHKPRIWRDPKLQGNDFFGDEVSQQLPKVAILIPVLTPRYIRSEWCQRELETFVAESRRGGRDRVGNQATVFKIVKTPIPVTEQPEPIQDLLGYDFFKLDPKTQRVREFSQAQESEYLREYWARFEDLAQDLCKLLEQLATQDQCATPAAEDGKRVKVYLADTAFDLRESRDALKRDLQQHGYTVLPDRTLPPIAPQLEATVAEGLAEAALSIHPIGASYGFVPEGATCSVLEIQNELAIARHLEGGMQRLIWIPSDLVIEDPRQLAFVDLLRQDEHAQTGADLLETPLGDIKLAMHQKLAPQPEEKASAGASNDGSLRRIYLICDRRDFEAAAPLEDHLYDLGFEVLLPAFDGDEAQVREDHLENLKLCHAVLLYWGQANELWLRAKLRDLLKIGGYGRRQPLAAKAIWIGAPDGPRKQRLRTHEAEVIHAEAGFDNTLLSPFLNQL